MRLCPACNRPLGGDGWDCAGCGNRPQEAKGVSILAPELSVDEGFTEDASAELAPIEDSSFWFRGRNRFVNWALDAYFPSAESLLEVGCGSGYVLRGVSAHRPATSLAGGEASAEALKIALTRVPGLTALQLDARELPFEEEFDVVMALDVLEHIESDEDVLASMYRATRSGGGVLVTVPQHPRLWSANDEYGKHKRRYTRRDLVEKVERAGYRVGFKTSFVSFLLPGMALSRLRQRRPVENFDPMAEYRIPPMVDKALERTLRLELALVRRGVSLPAGGSLLLVAQKP